MHVHVQGPDGEAKFWLERDIELAMSVGLPRHQVRSIQVVVEEHDDEIREAWKRHFGG